MAYAEKRGRHWRVRYQTANGTYSSTSSNPETGKRFTSRAEAVKWGDDEEARIRAGLRPVTLEAGKSTPYGDWASTWYAGLSLAPSTMDGYRVQLEVSILPWWQNTPLSEITTAGIVAWERWLTDPLFDGNRKVRDGLAPSSVRYARAVLSVSLADAATTGLIPANPAVRSRGRGRRAGRSQTRGPEKPITDPLGALLIAERASLLSGRDDEFVAMVLKYYTGMRWGELVGLEVRYARIGSIRIEHQLYERDSGELERCPPKDDSYRTVDIPSWLSRLLSEHLERTRPQPCPCHGYTYVFSGGAAGSGHGVSLAEVARQAGVSATTVTNVLTQPDRVAEPTQERVREAIAQSRLRPGTTAQRAPHWRRSGFATWVFGPAATGWYPKKAPQPAAPVPLWSAPWPGVPMRGRGARSRAQAAWLPIADGLTPHRLRHSHRTLLEQVETRHVLMDERMGHTDGSVSSRYAHVTPQMRQQLLERLTRCWEEALAMRAELCSASPVPVLDELLHADTAGQRHLTGGEPQLALPGASQMRMGDDTMIVSQKSPTRLPPGGRGPRVLSDESV